MDALTLGIDPSLHRTGYALINNTARSVVEAGVLRSSPKFTLEKRLVDLAQELRALLDEYSVSRMAVEDLYAHYAHPRTAILMGHARGVILLAAAEREIPVVSFSATRVKKSLTGNGHASKLQIQRAVMAALGLKKMPEPADVADAIAIALCAVTAQRQRAV